MAADELARAYEHALCKVALKAARAEAEFLRFDLALAQEKAIAEGRRARAEHAKLEARIARLEQQLSRLADMELGVPR